MSVITRTVWIPGRSKQGIFWKMERFNRFATPFVKIGYLLSAVSKPMLGMPTLKWWIFPKARVFGFHRSLDTAGAMPGQVAGREYKQLVTGLLWSSYGSQLTFMPTAGVAVLVVLYFLS